MDPLYPFVKPSMAVSSSATSPWSRYVHPPVTFTHFSCFDKFKVSNRFPTIKLRFEQCFAYVYTGYIDSTTMGEWQEALLQLGDKYALLDLKDSMERHLATIITE